MAFLLFAVVAAVTQGASNIMLTAAGAHAGILKGLPCLLGVTTGMALMMFLVPLGLAMLRAKALDLLRPAWVLRGYKYTAAMTNRHNIRIKDLRRLR